MTFVISVIPTLVCVLFGIIILLLCSIYHPCLHAFWGCFPSFYHRVLPYSVCRDGAKRKWQPIQTYAWQCLPSRKLKMERILMQSFLELQVNMGRKLDFLLLLLALCINHTPQNDKMCGRGSRSASVRIMWCIDDHFRSCTFPCMKLHRKRTDTSEQKNSMNV